jgi:hypothetical protein
VGGDAQRSKPLVSIADAILDEASSQGQLRRALDEFTRLCTGISGIEPDRSFSSDAGDVLLDAGVAINPNAAAHCVSDYRRSVVFIRGVYAAIEAARRRFAPAPLRILYAGCGPYATLLLPLLTRFTPGELTVHLLDIHPDSLQSVARLISRFGLAGHDIYTVQADACSYRHPCELHLIIAETMQKALEQEPQLAVTANLVPQLCPQGVFVPQAITVELCLARYQRELETIKHGVPMSPGGSSQPGARHHLATAVCLTPGQVGDLIASASRDQESGTTRLTLTTVELPQLTDLASFDLVLFTRVQVFGDYALEDFDSELTLPLKCHDTPGLSGGMRLQASYELGPYPRLRIDRV